MNKLIGTAPNQVPTNADLGTMAYLDHGELYYTNNIGLASTSPASSTKQLEDAGITSSGNYWFTDGVNTYQNYVLVESGECWMKVLRMVNNRFPSNTGTRIWQDWLPLGGSYDTSNGNVADFPSSSRLIDDNVHGYLGHAPISDLLANASTNDFKWRVKGVNEYSENVDKTYGILDYSYSYSGTSGHDLVPGLYDPINGNTISGSVANFTAYNDTNCRTNWGSTGIGLSTNSHMGIGIAEAGPNTSTGGGPGAFHMWHYNNTNYINFSFSNNSGTQGHTYSAFETFDLNCYIKFG